MVNPPLTDPQLLAFQGPDPDLLSRGALAIVPHHLRRLAGPGPAGQRLDDRMWPRSARPRPRSASRRCAALGFAVAQEGREIGERARKIQEMAAAGRILREGLGSSLNSARRSRPR